MKIKQHLQERHLNLELHRPILDEELNIATFLLYNPSGQIVGYQQYNPQGNKNIFNDKLSGKYYTYRNKNQPTIAIWGLESYYNSSGPIFLTEGIFDACRMTKVGQTALATLTCSPPKDYRNWLMMLNRPIVVVCDNDAAGRKLAKFGDYVEVVPEDKDLGESSDDYVQYLLTKYYK
jgi:DNA primase